MASYRIPSFQSPFLHSPRKQKANESLLRSKSKKCPGPRSCFFFRRHLLATQFRLRRRKRNLGDKGGQKKMLLKKENRRPIKWWYKPCNQFGFCFDCVHTCFPLPWVCCTGQIGDMKSLYARSTICLSSTQWTTN